MDRDYASFVHRNAAELIQRVTSVLPVADVLLSQGRLTSEAYSEIYAERTPQAKMRALIGRFLNSIDHKAAFYHALKKNEPFLVEELEHGPRTEGLTEASRGTQESSSDARHGEDSTEVEIPLEQRWNKTSQRWQAKLQDLLNNPNSQYVGNGNLFLCTEDEYEIAEGCNGTTVYIGMKADGTEVAIKRMLKSSNKEIKNEMFLLRHSDFENCNIVKYVDFAEDKDFYYLVLQLCEYNLEEYMKDLQQKEEEDKQKALKKVAKEFLLGLKVVHTAGVLHRDIKPRNVLIDVTKNARLTDFGISRRLNSGASSRVTQRAGTAGWESAEILNDDDNDNEGNVIYKKSSDIQVAGMLVHYILSDGHHPFGSGRLVEYNIMMGNAKIILQDVEAKDLIEEMIQNDPEKRLTIEEAIDHPYFWDDARRDSFLRSIGDEEPMHNHRNPVEKLQKAADKRSASGWKSKMPEDKRKDPMPDGFLGLLRYMRNLLVHRKSYFYENKMFKDVFPDFFINANKLAKEMGWKLQ